MALERLAMLITADARGAINEIERLGATATRELNDAEGASRNWSATFTRAGAVMIGAAGLIGAGMWKLGQAAADMGESVNKTQVIFKDSADDVLKWSEGTARSIGQSKRAALEAATSFGNLFAATGVAGEEAAAMSMQFTELASDLASFNNVDPARAVYALGAALRGEYEPARAMGVVLNEVAIKQAAMNQGLYDGTGPLDAQTKMMGAYYAVLEQTAHQQGDFQNTLGESMPNQMRVFQAQLDDLKTSLGEAVVPVMGQAFSAANDVLGVFNSLPSSVKQAGGTFATYGTMALGAAGAVSMAIGQFHKLRDLFSYVGTDGVRHMNRAGKAVGTFGIILGALAAKEMADPIIDSLTGMTRQVSKAMEEMESITKDVSEGMYIEFSRIDGALKDIGEGEMFSGVFGRARQGLEWIGVSADSATKRFEGFNAILKESPALAEAAYAALEMAFEDRGLGITAAEMDGYREMLDAAYESTVIASVAQDEYNERVAEGALEMRLAQGDTAALAEEEKKLADAAKEVAERQDKHRDALRRVRDAMQDARDRHDDLIASYDSMTTRSSSFHRAQADYATAIYDVQDAVAAVDAAEAEYGKGSPEYQRAMSDARLAVVGYGEKAEDAVRSIAELNGEQFTGQQAALTQMSALQSLAGQMPGLRWAIDPVLSSLRQLNQTYIAKVGVTFLDQAAARMWNLAPAGSFLGKPGNDPRMVWGFAEGGVVPGPLGAPAPAVVHGGEMVLTPEQQQWISSALVTASRSSGTASGSPVFNISVDATGATDPRAVGKAVVDALAAWTRSGNRIPSSWVAA